MVLGAITIQSIFLPSVKEFSVSGVLGQTEWLKISNPDYDYVKFEPVEDLKALAVYSAVTAPPEVMPWKKATRSFQTITSQGVPLAKMSWLAIIALAAWLALLSFGVWGIVCNEMARPLGLALLCFLAGQIVLHCLYGYPTFLYAGNYFPALLAIAAFGCFTPARRIVLALAILFIIVGGPSNAQQFLSSAAMAHKIVDGPNLKH